MIPKRLMSATSDPKSSWNKPPMTYSVSFSSIWRFIWCKIQIFFVHGNKELGEIFFPIKDLVVVLIQWLLYYNIYAVLHTLYSRKKIDKTFSPPLLTSDFQYTAVTFS